MRLLTFLFLMLSVGLFAQPSSSTEIDRNLPEFGFDKLDLAGQMYFLASDYLAGRRTGELGNEIAAEYIAAQLRAYGYEPINLADSSHFQNVPLRQVSPPLTATLRIGETAFTGGDNMLILRGKEASVNGARVVFANYGWTDKVEGYNDYADLDVEGKIVITRPGIPNDQSQSATFRGIQEKAEMAAAAGAVGIFEIYALPFPWDGFKNYLGGERMTVNDGSKSAEIPYGFIKVEDQFLADLQGSDGGMEGQLNSSGMRVKDMSSRNVGGILRGSDPTVADEYMVMTAHFDHVGVGAQGGGYYSAEDSIFNGARDNAFGTISLLAAARAFAEVPPRRSIIVLAVTGEELGLLGSKYYAEHPLVPLDQTVFNFNTDGAGYNDTSAISVIGMGRTGIDEQIERAAAVFNASVIANPAPEQGLFDRSDNVSFAAKGIPALNFAPGFTDFDDAIFKYYHQVTDNPETIDMAYLKRYCQIYTLAARLIANQQELPFWEEDDKYREVGEQLYGVGK